MLLQLTKLLTLTGVNVTQINPFYAYVQKINFNLLVKLKDINSIGLTLELPTKVKVKYKLQKIAKFLNYTKKLLF